MATFEEHICQAKNNLIFLNKINDSIEENWDWKVTCCFYVAVHLANAHIVKKTDNHYRTHEQVKDALNFTSPLSISKVPQNVYLAYVKLYGLSRRARYLCHEDTSNHDSSHITFDKHLKKALTNLDVFMDYFSIEYDMSFKKIKIDCLDIKPLNLKYFQYSRRVSGIKIPDQEFKLAESKVEVKKG